MRARAARRRAFVCGRCVRGEHQRRRQDWRGSDGRDLYGFDLDRVGLDQRELRVDLLRQPDARRSQRRGRRRRSWTHAGKIAANAGGQTCLYGTAGTVQVDEAGFVYVTGLTDGPIDFGQGVLSGLGGDDSFVAKLAP